MSTHDDLELLLPELDGPASPDPAFAARLRRQFVSAAGHQPATRPGLIPVQPRNPEPILLRPTRRRWLDLAAVAILLLGMIGGLTRITNTATTPTPAIPAPDTRQPAMVSGSAAMDGIAPGPAPASGEYRLRWWDGTGIVLPFRDRIYALTSRITPEGSQGIAALDAKTGAELWYQPVSARFTFAVTPAGVVAGMTAGPQSAAIPVAGQSIWNFHVVLLDLDTGAPIWRSVETYQLASAAFLSATQIADGTVLFVDRQLMLVAIDLATGQERWRVESPEAPAPVCTGSREQVSCAPAGPAVLGDMVYFDNPSTGQILAVSLSTGEQQWAVDDRLNRPEALPVDQRALALTAVDQGVLVRTVPASGAEFHFELLSAADGSLVWQWSSDRLVWDVVRAGDAVIVLSSDARKENWRLERVDLSTGDVLGTSGALNDNETAFLTSLPDANLVVLRSWNAKAVGFNSETLAVTWIQPEIEGCGFLVLPVLPNGDVACLTTDGLAVYELAPAPVRASPDTSIPGPVERGGTMVTTRPDVIMREEPAADAATAGTYPEAETKFDYLGTTLGSDGAIWYMVRDPGTARVGWILADDLTAGP